MSKSDELNLTEIAQQLYKHRRELERPVPYQSEVYDFAARIRDLMFPHFKRNGIKSAEDLERDLTELADLVCAALKPQGEERQNAGRKACEELIAELPAIQQQLKADASFIYEEDPAATSVDEVIAAYPGFQAILLYRVAHFCWKRDLQIFSRTIAEFAHQLTGVDIHPGAVIGSPFCIDHGTGIVIGETSVLGDRVKIYQGVTLGGLSVEKSMAQTKRHPTIEDDVIIYASAIILGGDTVVGKGSIIGGNVWLTDSVPQNSRVYHKPDIVIKSD